MALGCPNELLCYLKISSFILSGSPKLAKAIGKILIAALLAPLSR